MNRLGVLFVRGMMVLATILLLLTPHSRAIGQRKTATALDRTITAGSFAPKVDFGAGSHPLDVAAGDLDGDSKVDLAVTNFNSNTISVYLNASSLGSITDSSFKTKVDFTTGNGPHGITMSDLDGDGKLDIVVTDYNNNTISVFRNTSTISNISFAAKVDFATGSYPFIVVAGDLDGDGKPDLVVSNYHSDSISVFRNKCILGSITDSSFAVKVNFATGSLPLGVAICNIDGDGNPDIVVTNSGSNTISVFKSRCTVGIIADSSFAHKVDFSTGSYPFSLSVGDLDGDGKIDIATCNFSSNTISIFRNTTSGDSITSSSFAAKVDFPVGSGPYYVVIGDLNGDNKRDLVVSNSADSTLSVFQNTSASGSIDNSSFGSRINFAGSNFPYYLAICDVDGDGKPEMAVSNQNGNTISVFRNTVGTPAAPIIQSCTAGNGQVSLKWSKSPELDFLRYRIYCDTVVHPTTKVDSISNIADTSIVITGLTNGKLYYFRATAVDNGGLVSLYSNEVSAVPALVPAITSIAPISGPIGSTATITGLDFDANVSNNIAFFGGVRANLNSASETSLVVTVPPGAMYAPITVTVAGLTASSASRFDVTFSGGSISSSSFVSKVDFAATNGAHGLAIADLDGDGKIDLVATNQNSNTVSVFRNTSTVGSIGDSSFAAKVDFGTGGCPFDLAIGDLDGDGKLDLAVINYYSNTVSIMRNTSSLGNISFAEKVDFSTGSYPFDVAIGDLNGDGKPDLAVTDYQSDSVSVYQNKCSVGSISNTSFARVDLATAHYPNGVAIGDLDGDGKADIVVTSVGNNAISVFRNAGVGGNITVNSFVPRVDFSTGTYPIFTALGDLDRDGKLDIVTNNYYSNSISVFHNESSAGSITSSSLARIDYAAGSGPFNVKIGDLDGDGKPDLAAVDNPINSIIILRNMSPDGSIAYNSFISGASFATGNVPKRIAIGDLDGDGKPDLIVTNFNDTTVSVFRNTSDSPAPPKNLMAIADSSRVTLKWNRNTEEDFLRYRIYCDTVLHPIRKVDSTTAGIMDTSYVMTGLANGKLYYFRITAVDSSGLESAFSNEASATPSSGGVGVEDSQGLNLLPKQFELYQNYPNPFNPSTSIRFALPVRSEVRLVIYDMLGREIETLLDGSVAAGYQAIEWKATVATGLYFYRIDAVSINDSAKRFVSVKKMIVLR